MTSAPHTPVMLAEVLHALMPRDGGLYIDGTFGAGGYTRAILGEAECRVLGIDRDPTVRDNAHVMQSAFPGRFAFAFGPFSLMEDVIEAAGSSGADGVVLDLGVSSMQIDEAERGFSFQQDGPLDMRMARSGPSAADAVNQLEANELAAIFRIYGEERHAGRIARAIVAARETAPITRTLALAELVARVMPGKPTRIHPATRVFQALRIFINDELGELTRGLEAAERILRPAGRLVVVSFHSLEDRIVKTFLRARCGLEGAGSRHQPEQFPAHEPSFSLLTRKALTATDAEAGDNPRARSAKLRAASRTPAPAWPRDAPGASRLPDLTRLMEARS